MINLKHVITSITLKITRSVFSELEHSVAKSIFYTYLKETCKGILKLLP